MSEPILAKAHNIYEQQAHNRRMTTLLILVFVLLIAAIGIGFDVFLEIGPLARLFMLPFVLLMVASGIWHFKQRAAEGLWKKPQAFADDDDESTYFWWYVRLIAVPIILIIAALIATIIFCAGIHPFQYFSKYSNITILRYLPMGTTLAVIIGIVSILTSLHWGTNSILWSVHATKYEESDDYRLELNDIITEMSLAAGIQRPSIYIVKDLDPNAFTIGTSPMDSSIVVTTGLLEMLDRDELQGVIAHEMSHIRNADARLMTIITVLFGAVLLLSGWMKKSALVGGFAGSNVPGAGWILRGVLFIGWLITLLLAPLIARIVAMAVSRQREYLADAGGAELTRNPRAISSALIKIENAAEPTTSFQKGIAHMCIVDPLGKEVNSKEGWWADLFATHPPMKNRIMLLNAMAYKKTS